MSYLIIGASSGLGREIAYTFAKNKNDLIIVSRDEKDLMAIKTDLETRFNVDIKILNLNFSVNPNAPILLWHICLNAFNWDFIPL